MERPRKHGRDGEGRGGSHTKRGVGNKGEQQASASKWMHVLGKRVERKGYGCWRGLLEAGAQAQGVGLAGAKESRH